MKPRGSLAAVPNNCGSRPDAIESASLFDKPLLLIGGLTVGLFLLNLWLPLSFWSVIALAIVFVISYIVLMLRVGLPAADTLAVRALAQQLYGGVRQVF